jgi:hypothetical protein
MMATVPQPVQRCQHCRLPSILLFDARREGCRIRLCRVCLSRQKERPVQTHQPHPIKATLSTGAGRRDDSDSRPIQAG